MSLLSFNCIEYRVAIEGATRGQDIDTCKAAKNYSAGLLIPNQPYRFKKKKKNYCSNNKNKKKNRPNSHTDKYIRLCS